MLERLFLVDHYDSFTYNVKTYFEVLGADVYLIQFDDPKLDSKLQEYAPTALIFSPGHGHPSKAIQTIRLIKKYYQHYPMLGICLGHQCLVEAFGGQVIHAQQTMHGKRSLIQHTGEGLFENLPSSFWVTRYHSLMINEATLPICFECHAWTIDEFETRTIMAIQHQTLPIFGLQYHPEAILTEQGYSILNNFLLEIKKNRHNA